MNYEEFVEKYLSKDNQSNGVTYIKLPINQTSEWYKSIYGFIKDYKGDIRISSEGAIVIGTATKEEFLRSEELIQSIVENINHEWTTKQKAAYVHYKIGEIISYIPDQAFSCKPGNVVKAARDARNIWKSIDSGISVCNGIATIERNILSRVGVKTKELASGTHTFVLVETEEGNIISDPTWDLSNTLFEGRPMYFGKTYEQLQQIDGPLSKAHRLEETPENVVEISVEELREIYKSIGIAKTNGNFKFPILDKVNEINNQQFESENEKVQAFLHIFTQDFQKQATHLTETRTMIERCMPALGIDEKSFTTQFVYSKGDENSEKPYLCIHIAGEETQNSMAVLDIEQMKFEHFGLQNFDELYHTHNEDTREPFWKEYLQREENEKDTIKERSEK